MALIGVFGLHMSCRSGGAYRWIEGLMEHAHCSEHNFLYIHEATSAEGVFPRNVESVTRATIYRICAQGMLALPYIDIALSRKAIARSLLSVVSGLAKGTLCRVDGWLWPHCCSPAPDLRPMIAFFHDLIHLHHPEYFTRMVLCRRRRAEISIQQCAAILCPSHVVSSELTHTYLALDGKITTCWAAACEIVPREQCEEDSQKIRRVHGTDALFLYVAADWPHKNHALLIDAAMRLRPHRRFTVVFIGPRRTDRLRRLIEERHAGDRVVDLGPVSRTVLAAYYYAATCLVYPSLDEGFGIPLVEAMKCGTPIIASDAASIPEVCGDSAVFLPPTDTDLWAAEMCRMMDDADYRAGRSKAVLHRGRLFTWERSWQTIDAVLSGAVSGKRADAESD